MAKLMTWGDSHCGAAQLQLNSRLPGRHSKAHCGHKYPENMTWIGSLFFLHLMTHIALKMRETKLCNGLLLHNSNDWFQIETWLAGAGGFLPPHEPN